MREESLFIVKREPEVLAAAFRAQEGAAHHGGGETFGACQVTADRARVQDGGGRDGAAHHMPLKSRPDGFHFGQLGH
jgi:hypothetical protein